MSSPTSLHPPLFFPSMSFLSRKLLPSHQKPSSNIHPFPQFSLRAAKIHYSMMWNFTFYPLKLFSYITGIFNRSHLLGNKVLLELDYLLCIILYQHQPQQQTWRNCFLWVSWTVFHCCITFLKVKVTQSCLTLWDPMDYTVHGIL